MGGSVWVESAEGIGSTFHFTARFTVADVAPVRVLDTSRAENVRAARLQMSLHPVRVLLAEDNVVNQKVAMSLLTKLGHAVTLAGDGRQAVNAFARERFDAILMDMHMPEMGGLEATAAIREMERGRGARTPIVALTAGAMKEDREACLAAGMDDYLSKPIQSQRLADMLDRVTAVPTVSDEIGPVPTIPAEAA